jgi:tetratricopeptide (TPR) repeat protein
MFLVRVLYAQGKGKEAADLCRELMEIRRKRFGGKGDRVEEIIIVLVEILTGSQDDAGFEQLAKEYPKVWLKRSENLARRGKWTEAMGPTSRFLETQPDDHLGYYFAALLLVQNGERAAYEELCAKITARFAGATNPIIADRMARASLLLPRAGADQKVPGALAVFAATSADNDPDQHFFECGMALAEYRQRHWDGAIDWAEKAARSRSPYFRAQAYAIQAMVQCSLKQTDAARATLAKCVEVVDKELPNVKKTELGPNWRDWVIVHALLREAKSMIEDEK